VWLLGRTQIFQDELQDLRPVWKIQDEYQIYRLSEYPKQPRPHINEEEEVTSTATPPEIVTAMNAEEFFENATEIMSRGNPLSPRDPAAVKKLLSYGILPGEKLDWSSLTFSERLHLDMAKKLGSAAVTLAAFKSAEILDGWRGFPNTGDTIGNYGENYNIRAAVADIGLGANIPADAVYRVFESPYLKSARSKSYTLTFSAEKGPPPCNAFWSVTVYNSEGYLIANDLNRFALGSESALVKAADGSITIYLQSEEPEDKNQKQNWLPIPEGYGTFSLTARMYWPTDAILEEEWNMPKVEGVGEFPWDKLIIAVIVVLLICWLGYYLARGDASQTPKEEEISLVKP